MLYLISSITMRKSFSELNSIALASFVVYLLHDLSLVLSIIRLRSISIFSRSKKSRRLQSSRVKSVWRRDPEVVHRSDLINKSKSQKYHWMSEDPIHDLLHESGLVSELYYEKKVLEASTVFTLMRINISSHRSVMRIIYIYIQLSSVIKKYIIISSDEFSPIFQK